MEKVIRDVGIADIVQIDNSRLTYDDAEMAELMVSMRQRGLLTPIGLKRYSDRKWEVVWGNRRFRAAQKLGWTTIPAVEVDDVDKTEDMLIVNAIENLQRVDVPAAEQGRIFVGLRDGGLSEKEIAARIGTNERRVKIMINLYEKLPESMRERVVDGVPGQRDRGGKIATSTATKVIGLTSRHKLSREQSNELLEFASKTGVSGSSINKMGTLMREGFTAEEAMKAVEDVKIITLTVAIPNGHCEKLEKQYEMSIHQIVYECLKAEAWLGIVKSQSKDPLGQKPGSKNGDADGDDDFDEDEDFSDADIPINPERRV